MKNYNFVAIQFFQVINSGVNAEYTVISLQNKLQYFKTDTVITACQHNAFVCYHTTPFYVRFYMNIFPRFFRNIRKEKLIIKYQSLSICLDIAESFLYTEYNGNFVFLHMKGRLNYGSEI